MTPPPATSPSNSVDSSLLTQPWATVIGGACVVVAGLLAFFVAYYNRRQTEDHWRTSNRQDRFTTIASQLADPAPAVRLAGVYAMEALIDDWLRPPPVSMSAKLFRKIRKPKDAATDQMAGHGARQAQACVNVLCAYLRLDPPGLDQDGVQTYTSEDAGHALDREVRKSITTTITAHLRKSPRGECWSNLDFDFSDTTFGELDFFSAEFRGRTTFARATFKGSTTFSGARFGEVASFAECQFETDIFFTGAQFYRFANFSGSKFHRSVEFEEVEFHSRAAFTNCEFEGEAWFLKAKFLGSCSFRNATFNTELCFDGVSVHGNASFRRARFVGHRHDFSNLKIEPPGTIEFRGPAAWNAMVFDWDGDEPAAGVLPATDWPPRPTRRKPTRSELLQAEGRVVADER